MIFTLLINSQVFIYINTLNPKKYQVILYNKLVKVDCNIICAFISKIKKK